MCRKLPKTATRKTKPKSTDKVVDMPLKNPVAPKFGEWLLYLMPRQERLEFSRELTSDYREAIRKFGLFGADMTFYLRIGICFWPRIRRSLVYGAGITAAIKLLLSFVSIIARNS
jgi:hypothetical protein